MDTFLSQAGRGQAECIRARCRHGRLFRADLIEHGMILGGGTWEVNRSKPDALYFERLVYSNTNISSLCGSGVKLVEKLYLG